MIDLFSLFRRSETPPSTVTVVAPASRTLPEDDPLAHLNLPSHVPHGMAYPSREGYPMLDGASVVKAHEGIVRAAYRAFDARGLMPGFDKDFAALVHNFAGLVSLLPASQRHHHTKPGGLFAHSIDVATKALHYSAAHIVTHDSAPRDREADKFAWCVTAFLGGLLHDIGKVETIGRVIAASVRPDEPVHFKSSAAPQHRIVWRPEVSTLEQWLNKHRVETVYIDFERLDGSSHGHLVYPYFYRVVPRSLISLIFNSNPRIGMMMKEFLRDPHAALRDPLRQVVKDADHQSVRFDRDPQGLPGAIDLNTLIIRRFLEFAAEQKHWNTPSCQFHHAYITLRRGGRVRFLELDFWSPTAENVNIFVQYLRTSDTFGMRIPTNTDEVVFESLLQNGIICRTIPDVLQKQLPLSDLPAFNPASLATVRFTSRLQSSQTGVSTVHPITTDPIMLDIPLVALSRSPVPGHRDYMPVVSFEGEPGFPTQSLPVRIEGDELRPADEAQDEDPIALQEIEEATGFAADSEDESESVVARSLARVRAHARRSLSERPAIPREPERPDLSKEGSDGEHLGEASEVSPSEGTGTASPQPLADAAGTGDDDDDDMPFGSASTPSSTAPPPPAAAEPTPAPSPTFGEKGNFKGKGKKGTKPAGGGQGRSPGAPAMAATVGAVPEVSEPPAVWQKLAFEDWQGDVPTFLAILWLFLSVNGGNKFPVRSPTDAHAYLISEETFSMDGRQLIASALAGDSEAFRKFAAAWPGDNVHRSCFRNFIAGAPVAGFVALRLPVTEEIERALKEFS